MGCEHTLFSPGDEENFTHRPGILHLHKSVMVDAFGVVFRDAHRHRAHFVLQTLRGAQTTWRQEINYVSLAVNYTDLAFKRPFKNRKTTPNAGWLLVHHTPILYSTLCPLPSTSLCVCVCVFCVPMCLHRVYLVTHLTCIWSCKLYLHKTSKKELLIIQQRSVM